MGDSPVRGNVAKRQKGCRCAKNAPTIIHYSSFIIHHSLLPSAPSVIFARENKVSPVTSDGGGSDWLIKYSNYTVWQTALIDSGMSASSADTSTTMLVEVVSERSWSFFVKLSSPLIASGAILKVESTRMSVTS